MNNKFRFAYILLGLVLGLVVYSSLPFPDFHILKDLLPYPHQNTIPTIDPLNAKNVEQKKLLQKDRINRIQETCSKFNKLMDLKGYKKSQAVYYASERYNWSYCKIGKIGSTLMTKFFFVLDHDGEKIHDVLTKGREEIHQIENRNIRFGVRNSGYNTTRMIMSARNPYTRLFSAYIDRMFIPSTSISIRGQKDDKCKTQITFQEFLEFIVENTRNASGHQDYHWAPVFYRCKPCEVDPKFLITQETMATDFLFLLNQTKLETEKVDILYESMRFASNWSGYALVGDVLDFVMPRNHRNAINCQTYEQASKRLWEALKIQGFISDKVPFPSDRYKSEGDYRNTNIFRAALRHFRKKFPLSKDNVRVQRRIAMNRYYEAVHPDVLQGIKEVYAVDFEMFGYSDDPPPWR